MGVFSAVQKDAALCFLTGILFGIQENELRKHMMRCGLVMKFVSTIRRNGPLKVDTFLLRSFVLTIEFSVVTT
jgi:hypothetical protein